MNTNRGEYIMLQHHHLLGSIMMKKYIKIGRFFWLLRCSGLDGKEINNQFLLSPW